MQTFTRQERHHPSCPIPSGRRQQDAAQGIYMGNKFLALRKSEVAKAAPDRASIPSRSVRGGEGWYGIWTGRLTGIFAWRQ